MISVVISDNSKEVVDYLLLGYGGRNEIYLVSACR
jgi:hypothetical protein